MARADAGTPAQLAALAAQAGGYVPGFVADEIAGTFKAGTAEQRAVAAATLAEVSLVAPDLVGAVPARDAARAFATLEYVRHGLSPEEAAARADAAVLPDAAEETRRAAEVEAGGFARGNARWFSDQAGPQGLLGRLLRPMAPGEDDSRAILLPAYPERADDAAGSAAPVPWRGEEGERVALDEAAMHEGLRAAFDARFGAAFVATGDVAAAREMALRQAADEVLNGAGEGSEAGVAAGGETIAGEESDAALTGNLGDPAPPVSPEDLFADLDGEAGLRTYVSDLLKRDAPDLDSRIGSARSAEEVQVAIAPLIVGGLAALARIAAAALARRGMREAAKRAARDLGEGAAASAVEEAARQIIEGREAGEVVDPVEAITRSTEKAFRNFYDSVERDPLNVNGGLKDVLIPMDDVDRELDKILVDRGEGAFRNDGSVQINTRFGLFKIMWKHGPFSNEADKRRLTKEEILATPRVLRELEPVTLTGSTGEPEWVWVTQRATGERFVYVVKRFSGDKMDHLVTIRPLRPDDPRDAALPTSGPRKP